MALRVFFLFVLIAGIIADQGYVLLLCPGAHGSPVYAQNPKPFVITCDMTIEEAPFYGIIRGTCCPTAGGKCLPTTCNIDYEEDSTQYEYNCSFTVPAHTAAGEYIIEVDGDGNPEGDPFEIVDPPPSNPPCQAGYGALTRGGSCKPCPQGTYSNTTACIPCSLGTSSGTMASSCIPCAPGYYGTGTCNKAPAGWYAQGGLPVSVACSPGSFSASGANSCTLCPPGSYNSCPSSTGCTLCPEGKFTNVSGASICTPCAQGTYAAQTGSKECTPCPVNTYSSTLAATTPSSCISCPSNTSTLPDCAYSSLCCTAN